MNFIQNIKRALSDGNPGHRWERIRLLAKIEYKLRYYESKLGLVWALINPLFRVGIYYVVFKLIMKSSIENYALYLFSGIIIYQFFSEGSGGLMPILRSKRYLYEYSNMSKFEIYISNMLSISIGFAFNMGICILAMLIAGISITFEILWMPLLFVPLFFSSLGLGLIISNVVIILKDVKQIWPMISQMLFWISPIFFKGDSIDNALPYLHYFNPLVGLINNFRNITFYQSDPDFFLYFINIIQSLILMSIGLFLLNKIGKRASEIL